jgi:hypothetical protein
MLGEKRSEVSLKGLGNHILKYKVYKMVSLSFPSSVYAILD